MEPRPKKLLEQVRDAIQRKHYSMMTGIPTAGAFSLALGILYHPSTSSGHCS